MESLRPIVGADVTGASKWPPIFGSQPWLVLLSRGAGAVVVHENPLPFYNEMMGSALYGVDHFWRELSNGKANVVGSRSAGRFDLRSRQRHTRTGRTETRACCSPRPPPNARLPPILPWTSRHMTASS